MMMMMMMQRFMMLLSGVGLYERNEFVRIRMDPPWVALIGGRQRVLMAKSASMFAASTPLASITSISNSLAKLLQREA